MAGSAEKWEVEVVEDHVRMKCLAISPTWREISSISERMAEAVWMNTDWGAAVVDGGDGDCWFCFGWLSIRERSSCVRSMYILFFGVCVSQICVVAVV